MVKLFGKLFGVNCSTGTLYPEMLHEFAESLGIALDARDESTHNHSLEVADMALMLAQEMLLPAQRQRVIHVAGHLHDIGKIAIP
ncbi:MAG: HD domain-containing protein, partial [Deltaproteobacteria bacterium]|nr:HD domain-containing protein [Deltaproteobacteria bacterium]